MPLRNSLLLTVATLSLAACGDSPSDETPGTGGSPTASVLPQTLVGSWVEGGQSISVDYDPATGSYGAPAGNQLVYIFRADGTYTKQVRRYTSNGGCTIANATTVQGTARYENSALVITPKSGMSNYQDTCNPSVTADEPLPTKTLVAEQYGVVSLQRTALRLARGDGSEAEFRRFTPRSGTGDGTVATP